MGQSMKIIPRVCRVGVYACSVCNGGMHVETPHPSPIGVAKVFAHFGFPALAKLEAQPMAFILTSNAP